MFWVPIFYTFQHLQVFDPKTSHQHVAFLANCLWLGSLSISQLCVSINHSSCEERLLNLRVRTSAKSQSSRCLAKTDWEAENNPVSSSVWKKSHGKFSPFPMLMAGPEAEKQRLAGQVACKYVAGQFT